MRITKRYRVVKPVRFFVCILIMTLMLVFSLSALLGSSTEAATTKTYRQVVVHENETVWTIADEYCADGSDTRAQVNEICDINDVDAGDVQPGDTLIVPVLSE